MEHRKTPNHKVFVPPSWFLVATMLVCVGAAGWLGWLVLDDGSTAPAASATVTPTPLATTQTPSAEPSSPATTAPVPTESTPSEPTVERDAAVSVLNNTGVSGAAGVFAQKVQQAGWTVGGVGNWRGSVEGNTVYFPPGFEDRADLLAADVGIDRVKPLVATMRTDRLTIILAGPQ